MGSCGSGPLSIGATGAIETDALATGAAAESTGAADSSGAGVELGTTLADGATLAEADAEPLAPGLPAFGFAPADPLAAPLVPPVPLNPPAPGALTADTAIVVLIPRTEAANKARRMTEKSPVLTRNGRDRSGPMLHLKRGGRGILSPRGAFLILSRCIVDQAIDRDFSGSFVKELVVVDGPLPLAMVRKRLVASAGSTRGTVLLVHGFGQNRYAFHLPSRSFSNYLAHAGYDVFNLDLRGHGRSRSMGAKRPANIVEYVTHDMPAAVAEIHRHTNGRPIFMVGHSLGGLIAYFSAPTLGANVKGIASIGSPYHFTRGSFSLRAVARFFRMMELLQVPHHNPRLPLAPISAFMRVIRPVADSRAYLFPLRGWHRGTMEPHVLDQHLKLAFDRAGLAELRNMFDFANAKRFGGAARDFVERFEKHDVPLLVIAGENDDLAPPPSVEPGYRASGSTDKRYRTVPLGHIDLLCGRDARELTWNVVRDWIDTRSR